MILRDMIRCCFSCNSGNIFLNCILIQTTKKDKAWYFQQTFSNYVNAYIHSEISVRNRGGKIEDYLPIHDFIDSTKELCSDNRHRILHTMWGIKRVVIPVFGQYFKNSDGKVVNVKDLCEQDHVLPDYRFRFIPTLSDFVSAIDNDPNDLEIIKQFYEDYKDDKELAELLLSPLNNTGQIKSLLITHNSWFINEMVPKIFPRKMLLQSFSIAPSTFFNRMNFEMWMDNGADYPASAKKTSKLFDN